ncbi:MAG: 50S ribosomal protein L31 [Alphaproteobacteria bacterium]|nr:50S ribosomal protein L31 [Alphaproteobacteria bacterium]
MKDNLHPDYHEITVIMTDGTEFVTRSTYGQAGAKMHLDIDPKTHPAWTGLHRMVDRGGQLAKFNKRFAGLSKKDGAAEEAPAAAAAPAEKIKLTTSASTAKGKKKA